MRLHGLWVIALSVVYVLTVVVATAVALMHRAGVKARAEGHFIETFSIPAWWWILLVGPPLLLVAVWAWQRGAGGRPL